MLEGCFWIMYDFRIHKYCNEILDRTTNLGGFIYGIVCGSECAMVA